MNNPDNLAELIEFSEAQAWEDFFRCAPAEFAREYQLGTKRIGSILVSMIAKLDWTFFNRIEGLGIREAASNEQLDEAISIYIEVGCKNYLAQVSPLAGPPELLDWLEVRGFSRGRNIAKVYRGNDPPIHVQTDLRIERIGPGQANAFERINLSVFEMPDELGAMIRGFIGKPGWHHYLAYDGELPVSSAAMHISGEIAWLGFGSTLTTHRKRGGQGAMFARRIQDGLDLGCKWFVTETGEDTPESPNPSYHNMLRHGFKLAYLRPNYVHEETKA